jgi:hypothetical protein
MLASDHPTVKYTQSSVLNLAYGPKTHGGVSLGSLDLLDPQRPFEVINPISANAVERTGKKEKELWSTLPHATFDLVLMNPPFTRDTDHEGNKSQMANPMFAAFGFTTAQQHEMASAAEKILKGTSANGNAGEASAFLVLANRKLKDQGTLALVMPMSLLSGESWETSRRLLRNLYGDLIVVTIAGGRDDELSFSADTEMAECLVIGKKVVNDDKRAVLVVLNKRPSSQIIGATIVQEIEKSNSLFDSNTYRPSSIEIEIFS